MSIFSKIGIAISISITALGLCACSKEIKSATNYDENSYIQDCIESYFNEHKSDFRGEQGDTGATGEKGDKGDTGATGNGIQSVEYNASGELVITYTDGTQVNLGKIDKEEDSATESIYFRVYCIRDNSTVCSDGVERILSISDIDFTNAISMTCVNLDNNDYHASSRYHHHYILTYREVGAK